MYTKNLMSYNYNANISIMLRRKINLRKILFLLLFLTIFFTGAICFNNIFEYANNILVADFKADINMLSETASVLEIERISNKHSELNQFGSDGKLLSSTGITSDLSSTILRIVDENNDRKISDEEIAALGIMRLKSDVFQKKLMEFQFNLKSSDHNLENYIIITSGQYAGTIFYNGPLKYIDNQHKRYFGLELSTTATN